MKFPKTTKSNQYECLVSPNTALICNMQTPKESDPAIIIADKDNQVLAIIDEHALTYHKDINIYQDFDKYFNFIDKDCKIYVKHTRTFSKVDSYSTFED